MSSVSAGPSLSQGIDVNVVPDQENDTASNILRMSRQRKPQRVAVQ